MVLDDGAVGEKLILAEIPPAVGVAISERMKDSSSPMKVGRFISPPLKLVLGATPAPSFTSDSVKAMRASVAFSSLVSKRSALSTSSASLDV
jgi:hypothetical protein